MSLGLNGSSAGAGVGPVCGSYVGTGSAVTLEFDNPPKMLIIQGTTNAPGSIVAHWSINGYTSILSIDNSSYRSGASGTYITPSGNSLIINFRNLITNGYTFDYVAFF